VHHLAGPEVTSRSRAAADGISLADVLSGLRLDWRLVTLVMVICLAGAIGAGVIMPRTYRAEVVIAPVVEDGPGAALSGLTSQLGGLASLAGVSLGGSGDTAATIAVLDSNALLAEFIEAHDLLPVLFASDWDERTGDWRATSPEDEPTLNDGVALLDGDVRNVFEDKETGLVTLSVEWRDRQQAADWADALVSLANEKIRQRAIADARRNVEYLQQESRKSDVVSVQAVLNRLMDSDIQRIALANANPEYAFKVIDPARAPDADDYVSPNWPMLLVAALVFGGAVSLLIVVWRRTRTEGMP
jgi:uncharacterized protein involved in exopolysaccharide biosynthesis